jgi:hypothetical protein
MVLLLLLLLAESPKKPLFRREVDDMYTRTAAKAPKTALWLFALHAGVAFQSTSNPPHEEEDSLSVESEKCRRGGNGTFIATLARKENRGYPGG